MSKYIEKEEKAKKYLKGQLARIEEFKQYFEKNELFNNKSIEKHTAENYIRKAELIISTANENNLDEALESTMYFFDGIPGYLITKDIYIKKDINEAIVYLEKFKTKLTKRYDVIKNVYNKNKSDNIADLYQVHCQRLLQGITNELYYYTKAQNEISKNQCLRSMNRLIYSMQSWLYPIKQFYKKYKTKQKQGSGNGSMIIVLLILAIIVIIFCIISFFTNQPYEYYQKNKLKIR